MATQKRYDLVDGPSKFDLMLALFTGKKVNFSVDGGGTGPVMDIAVTINLLEIEDGSRENWLLKGYVKEGLWFQPKTSILRFRGYFGCHRRRGWAEFY